MGCYVYSPRVFKAAARSFVRLIHRCDERGIRIRSLSLGGGFPAAIGEEEAFPIEKMKDFPRYFQSLLNRYDLPPIHLIFEPGKSIVMNAGIGLMKVVSRKRLGLKKRVIIADGSTYNFIPDALIQNDVKYDILPASKMNAPRIHTVSIAGNTCDCWDIIRQDIEMPKLRPGDLLAAMDVGAYAQVMSSNFNTIRRPAMILLAEDGSARLIRRHDRYSEMFAPELDVLKIAEPDELEKYHNLYRVNIDKIWKGKLKKGTKQNLTKAPAQKSAPKRPRSGKAPKNPPKTP
jgi:diaminopimelate decarboxylase